MSIIFNIYNVVIIEKKGGGEVGDLERVLRYKIIEVINDQSFDFFMLCFR